MFFKYGCLLPSPQDKMSVELSMPARGTLTVPARRWGVRAWHTIMDRHVGSEDNSAQVHLIRVIDYVGARLIGNYVNKTQRASDNVIVHSSAHHMAADLIGARQDVLNVCKKRHEEIENCRLLILVWHEEQQENTLDACRTLHRWLEVFSCSPSKILVFCKQPVVFPTHMRNQLCEPGTSDELMPLLPRFEMQTDLLNPWKSVIAAQICAYGPKVMAIHGFVKTHFGVDAFIEELLQTIASSVVVYRDPDDMEAEFFKNDSRGWHHLCNNVRLFCLLFSNTISVSQTRLERRTRILLRQFTKIMHPDSQILLLIDTHDEPRHIMPAEASYLLWHWTPGRDPVDLVIHEVPPISTDEHTDWIEGFLTAAGDDMNDSGEHNTSDDDVDADMSDMSTDVESEEDFFG